MNILDYPSYITPILLPFVEGKVQRLADIFTPIQRWAMNFIYIWNETFPLHTNIQSPLLKARFTPATWKLRYWYNLKSHNIFEADKYSTSSFCLAWALNVLWKESMQCTHLEFCWRYVCQHLMQRLASITFQLLFPLKLQRQFNF